MIDYSYYKYDIFNYYQGKGYFQSWSYGAASGGGGGGTRGYRTLMGVGNGSSQAAAPEETFHILTEDGGTLTTQDDGFITIE